MTTIVNSAIGLSIGDQVRVGTREHTIKRIWLYEPGEYEPYNAVSPGLQIGVAANEPVVSLECEQRLNSGRSAESYLHGIVRRGDSWRILYYDWPAFKAPDGMMIMERIQLHIEKAPPTIVDGEWLYMVSRSAAPLQLDLFATTQGGHRP